MLVKTVAIACICLLSPLSVSAYDIGLVPLHSSEAEPQKPYGKNISLHGTPDQVSNLRT